MVWDILADVMFFFLIAIAFGGLIGFVSGYVSFGIFGVFLIMSHIVIETSNPFLEPILYVGLVIISVIIGARAYDSVGSGGVET